MPIIRGELHSTKSTNSVTGGLSVSITVACQEQHVIIELQQTPHPCRYSVCATSTLNWISDAYDTEAASISPPVDVGASSSKMRLGQSGLLAPIPKN